jgi:hypothetical protein
MTIAYRLCLGLVVAWFIILPGCEIVTEPDSPKDDHSAGTLVINELFTLPVTEPQRFNWIEFLNPTGAAVELKGWTLEFTTYEFRTNIDFAIYVSGDTIPTQIYPTFSTGIGRHRVPLTALQQPRGPGDIGRSVIIPAGGLYTMVDNEARLKTYTDWGPGNLQLTQEVTQLYGPVDSIREIGSIPDTVTYYRAGWSTFAFYFLPTDELVLRDSAGTIVDVVRYGNYAPPSPDPYPGNQSIGLMPPFESIYRYAAGYKTNIPWGNTANDFAISSRDIRPIPQWYSQPHHP